MAVVGLKHLCPPAMAYLAISMVALIIMVLQNSGNTNLYCLGSYNCDVPSTSAIFVVKVVYIVFWTWILNMICRSGATSVAWFLVILPFALMFIFIGMLMISQTDVPGPTTVSNAIGASMPSLTTTTLLY
jgi:hypothetical protein